MDWTGVLVFPASSSHDWLQDIMKSASQRTSPHHGEVRNWGSMNQGSTSGYTTIPQMQQCLCWDDEGTELCLNELLKTLQNLQAQETLFATDGLHGVPFQVQNLSPQICKQQRGFRV